MATPWFYEHDGDWEGPFSATQLRELVREGRLTVATRVRNGLMPPQTSLPAGQVQGLFAPLTAYPQVSGTATSTADPSADWGEEDPAQTAFPFTPSEPRSALPRFNDEIGAGMVRTTRIHQTVHDSGPPQGPGIGPGPAPSGLPKSREASSLEGSTLEATLLEAPAEPHPWPLGWICATSFLVTVIVSQALFPYLIPRTEPVATTVIKAVEDPGLLNKMKAQAAEVVRLQAARQAAEEKLAVATENLVRSKSDLEALRANSRATDLSALLAKHAQLENLIKIAQADLARATQAQAAAEAQKAAAEEQKANLQAQNQSLTVQVADAQAQIDALRTKLNKAPPAGKVILPKRIREFRAFYLGEIQCNSPATDEVNADTARKLKPAVHDLLVKAGLPMTDTFNPALDGLLYPRISINSLDATSHGAVVVIDVFQEIQGEEFIVDSVAHFGSCGKASDPTRLSSQLVLDAIETLADLVRGEPPLVPAPAPQ